MNMLLSSPKSPLWACAWLGTPLPGTRASKQVLTGQPVLQACTLQTVGDPLALLVYMWAWNDMKSHLSLRTRGRLKWQQCTSWSWWKMTSVFWTEGCCCSWDGMCWFWPHSSLNPDILYQSSEWRCKTSSQLNFMWLPSPERKVLVTPFRQEVSAVHPSTCAEWGRGDG